MPSRGESLRIVVLGYIVRGPLGGLVWHHLQYLLGLRQLGHDVYFLEDSDDYPSCYDPSRHVVDVDPSYGIRFANDVFSQFKLADRWGYYDAHTSRWLGPLGDRAIEVCRTADLVLNLSAVNPLRWWWQTVPRRALVDTDPAFTQLRHLQDESARRESAEHTSFHTFAENVLAESCAVPKDGFPWQPTRQPIVVDCWPVKAPPPGGRYTTVMQWASYPAVEHEGQRYGMKSDSFEEFITLPHRVGASLELALGSEDAPRSRLQECGWQLQDPLAVTRTPFSYQRYLESSRGEFSVAKHGYVVSRSGWFSERSAAYLACGRPVVTQDTGFTEWLPSGKGLLAFTSAAEAVDLLERVESDHARHCEAAREIATEYFEAKKVLAKLVEDAYANNA